VVLTRLWPWSAEVGAASLRADALAGLLGAVLVLPQGVAFATLAGLPPQYGLYTAIVPCVVAALAGSSRHVASGPTNAISLALVAMMAPLAAVGSADYIELVLVVTLLVGALQLLVGLLRLGGAANFISPSALKGFTAGAALLIVWHAIDDVLGRDATHATWNHAALAVAGVTLAVALALRALSPRLPSLLLGLAAGTLTAWLWNRSGTTAVATVGAIGSPWPPLHLPRIDAALLPDLLGKAGALTIVALGQSISIAKAVAARSGQAIDANREFVGQGLSNLVGGLFSSYVSTGSLNRSLPNYEAGARTPLASVFSALWLLALVAFSAPLLALIPFAAIGALLLLVAWSLFDWPGWRRIARTDRTEFAIAAVTALATVALRLEIAILLGTLLSLVAHLYVTSRPAMRSMGFDDRQDPNRPFVVVDTPGPGLLPECPQLKLLRMEGSVYFGAVAHVGDKLRALRTQPEPQRHLLVMSKSMNFIDLAGADLWREELRARRAMGGDLYFHRPRPQVFDMWQRTGFIDELGADHIFRDKRSAIATIVPRLDPAVCERCTVKLFFESPGRGRDAGS
jgi:SulP family sulfate permease